VSDLWSNVVTGVASVAAGWGAALFTLRHARNQADNDRLERRREERVRVYATAHDAVAKLLISAAEREDLVGPCTQARHALASLFFVAPDQVEQQVNLLGRALTDLELAPEHPDPLNKQAFDQLDNSFFDLTTAMRDDLDITSRAVGSSARRRWWPRARAAPRG
jgi:hypothetical protein